MEGKQITKEEYIEQFGEDPEDMFGGDWQNIIKDLASKECPIFPPAKEDTYVCKKCKEINCYFHLTEGLNNEK